MLLVIAVWLEVDGSIKPSPVVSLPRERDVLSSRLAPGEVIDKADPSVKRTESVKIGRESKGAISQQARDGLFLDVGVGS